MDKAPDLAELWQQILGSLELPSTRMLLSQQAQLVHLDDHRAVVSVAGTWMAMVQSRKPLVEQALATALGHPRQLVLEGGGEVPAGLSAPVEPMTRPRGKPVTSPSPQPVQESPPTAAPAPHHNRQGDLKAGESTTTPGPLPEKALQDHSVGSTEALPPALDGRGMGGPTKTTGAAESLAQFFSGEIVLDGDQQSLKQPTP